MVEGKDWQLPSLENVKFYQIAKNQSFWGSGNRTKANYKLNRAHKQNIARPSGKKGKGLCLVSMKPL